MGNTPDQDASSGVIILIGNAARLDLTSRSLIRVDDGSVATLSASASRCLCSFVDSVQRVLSTERLIEDGWRSQGLEATENSVRVMISQLRRAIATLRLQHEITIQTVSGEGYMMLLRQNESVSVPDISEPGRGSLLTRPDSVVMEKAVAEAAQVKRDQSADAAKNFIFQNWLARGMAAIAGLLCGAGLVKWIISSFLFMPVSYHYVAWTGEVPPGKSVWVSGGNVSSGLVSETLRVFQQYVSEENIERPYLYINDGFEEQYLSLFACRKPVDETENGCETYFFRKS